MSITVSNNSVMACDLGTKQDDLTTWMCHEQQMLWYKLINKHSYKTRNIDNYLHNTKSSLKTSTSGKK